MKNLQWLRTTLMLCIATCLLHSCVPAGVWLRSNLTVEVQPKTMSVTNNRLSYEVILSGNMQVLTLVDSLIVELSTQETGSKVGTVIFYGRPDMLGEPPLAFNSKKKMDVFWDSGIKEGVEARITLMKGQKSKTLRFKDIARIL